MCAAEGESFYYPSRLSSFSRFIPVLLARDTPWDSVWCHQHERSPARCTITCLHIYIHNSAAIRHTSSTKRKFDANEMRNWTFLINFASGDELCQRVAWICSEIGWIIHYHGQNSNSLHLLPRFCFSTSESWLFKTVKIPRSIPSNISLALGGVPSQPARAASWQARYGALACIYGNR